MTEIRVQNLCKTYGDHVVLHNLSFTAGVGITRILGRSGAGKTTLLRILLGLDQPDSGSLFGTTPMGSQSFKEDRLLGHLDAEDNLRFALGSAYNAAAAKTLLGELGLARIVGSKPICEYSGGMKRRLALARALLAPSDALILDEPFTGLDEENRSIALRCILHAAQTKPVLLASHEALDLPTAKKCGSDF